MNNKTAFLVAFALLCGAKAFAQEWEYSIKYSRDTMLYFRNQDIHELHNGNIVVNGDFSIWNHYSSSPHNILYLLSSEGHPLAHNIPFKPSFWNYGAHFIENDAHELFMLTSYNPEHDYEIPNYYMNFDSVPDYGILGLYQLDDSLRIVRSMEHRITVDTFEMRGHEFWEHNRDWQSGYIWPLTAFVDDDGYIVGNYLKAVSFGHEEIANDTVVFFRMDFDGNFITKVDYACVSSMGGSWPINWIGRSGDMVKINDSTYVMYDTCKGLFGHEGNVVYLDRDFNIIRVRRISHHPDIPQNPTVFQHPSFVRSPRNTTYVSTTANETQNTPNTYVVRLYEYDETEGQGTNMQPLHSARRNYTWDYSAYYRALEFDKDGCAYFAYTLNVGFCYCFDSWMVIEKLDENMETLSTFYYDINGGTDILSEAYSIRLLSDGNLLLTSISKDNNDPDLRWTTVTKFSADTFVGIEEAHDNGLKVAVAYPNPGGNTLNICTGLKNARLEVYDGTGRLIHGQEITESETSIDAASWPAGVYVWKVYSNGKEAECGKWVKE
jgi:hypothetical protein